MGVFDGEQNLFRKVKEKKDKGLSSLVFILASPVLIYIITVVSMGLFMMLAAKPLRSSQIGTAFYPAIELAFSSGVIIVLVFLITVVKEKRSIKTLGFYSERNIALQYLKGVLAGIGMFGIALGIIVLFSRGQVSFKGIKLASSGPFFLMILAWIIQGASEEVMLRGYMFPALTARISLKAAIIISSLFFAFMHLFNNGIGPISLINITLVGVFAALYAMYDDGIWGVCGWHSAWNFAQGNLFGCFVSGTQPDGGSLFVSRFLDTNELITGGLFGPEASIIVTGIFCTASWFLYLSLKKRSRKKEKEKQ